MPYIESKVERRIIDQVADPILFSKKGNLNYFLCKLFLAICDEYGMSYGTAKDFIGEIECAKMELYRRWVVPYENKKMKENGDVNGEEV